MKKFLIIIFLIICHFIIFTYERDYSYHSYYKTDSYNMSYKYYYKTSNLKTIMIFYGFGGSIDMMDAFMPYLKENYNILCIDYPGHGFSKEYSEFNLDLFSSSAKQLLLYLKIDKIYLIGYSFGGIVALDFYKKNTTNVEKLILWHTSANFSYSRSRKFFFNFIKNSLIKNYEFTLKYVAIPFLKDKYFDLKKIKTARIVVMINNPESVIDYYNKIINLNYETLLQEITCPVFVIGSYKDILVPADNSIKMAKKIKNSVLIMEKDTGHFSIVSKPEVMAKKIIAFIE